VRTDDLIQQLASDVQPVVRLRPVVVRLLGWLVLAALSFGVVLFLMGVRRELGDTADQADFAFQAALLIVTAMSAAVGALDVSVPCAERSPMVRWAPVLAAAASVLWAVGDLAYAAAIGAPTGRLTFAWHCVYKTSCVGAVPGIALFVMVRRAAPLRAAWAGLLAVLATAAVGVLGANVICPNDRPLHLLLWHVAPLILFAALGAALGTWLLDWAGRARLRGREAATAGPP
jgi:hypothetical protein